MMRTRGPARILHCALALLLANGLSFAFSPRCAANDLRPEPIPTPREATGDASTNGEISSRPIDGEADSLPRDVVRVDQPLLGEVLPDDEDYSWQWLPIGLIYHSYMAGEHEPRMGLFTFSDLDGQALADATLGGRVGFLRYGNDDPMHPVGYQLDFYGAAIARLDLNQQEDLVATDYVFGLPITWGDERWQWKFGYAHLSSHLGDELAIRIPGALNNRVNYVRDSLVLGTSYFVVPAWRIYGETGWAFNADGGAKPWETQFGTELSYPGPTGPSWTPFLAVNGRLRQENNFSGDLTLQFGWLRRNILDRTLRFGGQFYNGKSNQFEFFNRSEQQIGMGLWYDF